MPADRAGIQLRGNSDDGEWNYIRSQADADDFMRQFVCFHDAVLEKMEYTEAPYNSLRRDSTIRGGTASRSCALKGCSY